jgi:hypothetical protein
MEIPPFLIVLFIAMVYVVSSIKILAEYERGVIFRLGKAVAASQGPGRHPGLCANRPHGSSGTAHRGLRRAATGCDYAGQRLGQGERGRLLPRDRPTQRRSSKSRTTTTRRRSCRRRRCAACWDRWNWTICCRSVNA